MSKLHLSHEILPAPRPNAWRRLLRGVDRIAGALRGAPERAEIHALGQEGEDLAYWTLRRHGYTIVARNFRLPGRKGEVDLIAWEGTPPTLVFVEVKTRTVEGNFPGERAVDAEKRKNLIRMARAYRRRRSHRGPVRFDVVAIYGPANPHPRVVLHRNAFFDGRD